MLTCIWLLHLIHLHLPSLLPYALLASPLPKPQLFLRQSHPSAQMTLLHHLALCRLPSLEFPCSGFSFSLLLNIFHNLLAIHLNPLHNVWQPLLRTPLPLRLLPHYSSTSSYYSISPCAISSLNGTQCAAAYTTSTMSTCALRTVSKGTQYKREQSWSAMLVRNILNTKHQQNHLRVVAIRIRVMERQAMVHTDTTRHGGIGDETYCLR